MSRHIRRTDSPERAAPAPAGVQRPLIPAGAGASLYLCGTCDQQWPYPAVRHTARCPTCGGGLVRADDVAEG